MHKSRIHAVMTIPFLAMAIFLSSCTPPPATATPTSGGVSPTQTPQASADPLMKYDPAIQMLVGQFVADESKFPAGETPEKNGAYQVFKDVVGIEFIPQFTASYGQPYFDKLKLQITSDDLPDMAYASIAEIDQLIRGDSVVDMAPLIEQYGSETLKSILYAREKAALSGVTRDGAVYAIPSVVDMNNGVPLLYIRKDVFEKTKLALPKTITEVASLAKAMMEADSGIKYGIGFYKELSLPFHSIMNAFGAYPGMLIRKEDGKYEYGTLTQATKDALLKVRAMVESGVIDQDFATTDATRVEGLVGGGKIAMYITEFWQPLTGMGNTVKNVPGSDWIVMRIPSEAGGDIEPFVPLNVNNYYFVRKGYEHPEALIIALNHFVSGYADENSAFSQAWKVMSEEARYKGTMLHSFLPIFMDNPTKNMEFSILLKASMESGDVSALNVGEKDLYEKIKAGGVENWPWAKIYLESVPAAAGYATLRYNGYLGAPTKEMATYGSTLGTLEGKTLTEILAGTKPIEAFDEFVAIYLKQGGQQILDSIAGK